MQESNSSFFCLYCDGIGSCTCDPADVVMNYYLFDELPKALADYKQEHGSYPIRAWNKPEGDKNV